MDESSEIAKILRYILFGFSLLHVIVCQPLVNEPRQTVPFYNSEEVRSELAPSFSEHRERDSFRPRFMQPNRDDLDPDQSSLERPSGGHKGTRQVHSPNGQTQQSSMQERRASSSPLCSVFRMFIDPRRLSRCRNRNSESFDRESSNNQNEPLPNNELSHDHEQGNSNYPSNREDYHQHEERSRDSQDYGGGGEQVQEPGTNKRYDLLDEGKINHSGEEEDGDQNLHPGGRMPMMMMNHQDPTKVSQDRTMIVVPERSCPQGQRRDQRGYCRRLVKIRTNYQYGPPPGVVRPIPIRYYYSRIVSIPTLHFFFPNA